MLRVAGKDATKEFNNFHNAADVLRKYGPNLYAGELATSAQASAPAAPAAQVPASSAPSPARAPAPTPAPTPAPAPSAAPKSAIAQDAGGFGELIPYGDPNWYQGWNSNYYNESHRKFRLVSFSL